MDRSRWARLGLGVVIVIAACGAEPSPTHTSVPATSTTVAPLSTSTTTQAPVPSSSPSSSTSSSSTAPVVESSFVIESAPPDGTFVAEPVFDWPMWGTVRPAAVVTVNGREVPMRPLVEMHPDSPDDAWYWSTYADEGGIGFDLTVGRNELVIRAGFADGEEDVVTRILHHDPELEVVTGYVIEASSATGTVTLEVIPLGYGEFGVEEQGEGEIAEFPVADAAIFILLAAHMPGWAGGDVEFYEGVDLARLADLAARVAAGEPLTGLYYRTIQAAPALELPPAPWEFLVAPDGTLYQGLQLYSP